jgi:dsDNA-binding SOS-regulon protein
MLIKKYNYFILSENYSEGEITLEQTIKLTSQEDVNAIGLWLKKNINDINYILKYEPINKFQQEINDMENSYSKFPKEKKRTEIILNILRNGEDIKPIFYEDRYDFILEGRHRIVAFKLFGLKEVPVIYVR